MFLAQKYIYGRRSISWIGLNQIAENRWYLSMLFGVYSGIILILLERNGQCGSFCCVQIVLLFPSIDLDETSMDGLVDHSTLGMAFDNIHPGDMIHWGHLLFSPAPLAFESIERLQHHQWLVASIPRLKIGVIWVVFWVDGQRGYHPQPQRRYYSDRWPRNNRSSSYLKQSTCPTFQLGERNTPLKDRSLSFPKVEN